MDAITDLTAQAVACLTIMQDMFKAGIEPEQRYQLELDDVFLWNLEEKRPKLSEMNWPDSKWSFEDLFWCSPDRCKYLQATFIDTAEALLEWLMENHLAVENGIPHQADSGIAREGTLFCTPWQWRTMIRKVLYHKPALRTSLARILHYMPVQIIFCLGGEELDAADQRVYQSYNNNKGNDEKWNEAGREKNEIENKKQHQLLDDDDQEMYDKWWDTSFGKDGKTRRSQAAELLESDALMLKTLQAEEIPLPFETLFNSELDEICRSRRQRRRDNPAGFAGALPGSELAHDKTEDPLERAGRMQLHGLAFSGGGIRSATFNLGVLQKLAEENKLSRFDYLSTVSGGGYIGTWLASWIKRSGSVAKVADRLDSRKSADPMGEEVRPVRWLRMFSNYLAPEASVMSADSWTMGITWLRNTLINQFILLLLLITVLSAVNDVFDVWRLVTHIKNTFDWQPVAAWSTLIFLPGVVMAGYGMQTFDKKHAERSLFNFGRNRRLSLFLIAWAVMAAYFISSWLYAEHPESDEYMEKVGMLLPAAIAGFAAMLAIAYIGYYRACAQTPGEKKYVDFAIVGSSLVAAAAGWFLLSGVWELFQYVKSSFTDPQYGFRWVFISGPPLILESISCCVVIRMALMGRLFPDQRREWWGRMGAIVHRFILIWLLATIGALILPDIFRKLYKDVLANLPVIFGGWAAIIGSAVKLAYQTKPQGPEQGGAKSVLIETFIGLAPYLFMLGFLLVGAYLLQYIDALVAPDSPKFSKWMLTSFEITAVAAALTALLSWRVGVNEFSLHHFYRNRLVRAYMGATRRRTDRDRTANKFTGFDRDDDIKLSGFVSTAEKGPYYGPYPILNATLNSSVISELDRQDRKAESFVFTPLYCGFDFSPTRSAAYAKDKVYEYGYRPTIGYAYEQGPTIGTAMAISGAAVNPNMGYHSAPATAFLLTMFNVRLGWWIGNPRLSTWKQSDPTFGISYLVSDLAGKSDIDSRFVCLSDGGHFDNMGLYELVRRRCSNIILCDAEEDRDSTCEGLANAIRRCRIDFGAEITIDVTPITKKDDKGISEKHSVTNGTIKYPGETTPSGTITYVKTSLTKDITTDLREYSMNNPLFPQQPTSDQFFTEEQFESYRKLGYQSV